MNVSDNFKREYNRLIKREKKGREIIDNPNTPLQKNEKYIPEYLKICDGLSEMLDIYKRITKKEMDIENIFDGFPEVE